MHSSSTPNGLKNPAMVFIGLSYSVGLTSASAGKALLYISVLLDPESSNVLKMVGSQTPPTIPVIVYRTGTRSTLVASCELWVLRVG